MSSVKANGPAIEKRYQEMLLEEANLNYGAICQRTGELGPGFSSVSEKVLYRARKSENVEVTALKALAKVMAAALTDFILEPEADGDKKNGGWGTYINESQTAISAEGAPAVTAKDGSTVTISITDSGNKSG